MIKYSSSHELELPTTTDMGSRLEISFIEKDCKSTSAFFLRSSAGCKHSGRIGSGAKKKISGTLGVYLEGNGRSNLYFFVCHNIQCITKGVKHHEKCNHYSPGR